jgi:hypothetical protein
LIYGESMFALSARVPGVEVPRAEIIPVRVARKIAPLLGVAWEQNPFSRTWVCDYSALTLAEIARGAPLPSRQEQALMDATAEPDATWDLCGRAVWTPGRTPTPTALSNASINRYGPDTKAAVVLTGVNVLLRDATSAISEVCRHMRESGTGESIQLAVWAGLVLEAYRAQPALVTAGIQARAVQRSLKLPWLTRIDAHGVSDAARCEVNFGSEGGKGDQPHRLDLIDETLRHLDLPTKLGSSALGTSSADVIDAVADRWAQRLLEVGRPGRGILWLVEDPPGHRTVQTYTRVGSIVAPLVAELMRHGSWQEPGRLYRPPDDLTGASPTARRAHLIAVHIAVNYLRFRDDLLAEVRDLRAETRAVVSGAEQLAHGALGADDPVTVTLLAYSRYLTLTDLNRTPHPDREDLAAAVSEVLDAQDLVVRAWQDGRLDPGTVAYLLEIMNVESGRASASLPDPQRVRLALAEHWRHHFAARGIDLERDLGTLSDAHRYHLHNYTSYLLSVGDPDGLAQAYRLQQLVAGIREKVTAAEPAGYVAKYTSSRNAHEIAASIAGALLETVDPADAPQILATGIAHVEAVLANPTMDQLLTRPTTDVAVVWAALRVLPLAAIAVESGALPADRVLALLEAAQDCAPQDEQLAALAARIRAGRAQ